MRILPLVFPLETFYVLNLLFLQSCPGGRYSNTSGLEICVQCSAGKFCPLGSSQQFACDPGLYSDIGSASCSSCLPGYQCPTPDQQERCPENRYSVGGK